MNTKLSLEVINNALTALDPTWAVGYAPWGDSVICHMTVNGINRSHVGNVGATEIERYEDAFRNAARMFGVGVESRLVAVGRCVNGSAFKVTTAPADFAAAVEEVLSRRFVATIRCMDGCEDERIGAEFCEAPYLY